MWHPVHAKCTASTGSVEFLKRRLGVARNLRKSGPNRAKFCCCWWVYFSWGWSRAGRRRGFKRGGGFPDLDLSFHFCPFLSSVFSGTFPICPGFSQFSLGFSRSVLFLPLGLVEIRTYKEHSRQGPRHNQELSRKNGNPPRFGNLSRWTPKMQWSLRRCNPVRTSCPHSLPPTLPTGHLN